MEAERIVDEPEGESEERRALRLLLGGKMLRKRRLRRLLLAHLLRQGDDVEAVSYTHLTLPTILRV